MSRPSKPDCDVCLESYIGTDISPPCYESCGKVELLKDNYITVDIMDRWISAFKSGDGGVSLSNILTVLNLEGIDQDRIVTELEKIVLCIKEITKNRGSL